MSAPDFLAIGHVTLDRVGDTLRPGGAALYAAVTAHRVGISAGILTSHGDDFPLELIPPKIEVASVPAEHTTRFTHATDRAGGRRLTVHAAAALLGPSDVPDDWRDAPLVLLAPVFNEVDPRLATAFPDAVAGASAQGWLRRRTADGTVTPAPWTDAGLIISRIQVLFLSDEDARGAAAGVIDLVQQVPLGVVTAGRDGALVFVNGERYEIPPHRVREVDPTGAGDVFAAAFLLRYERDGDAWDAAAGAACAAALSVEGEGFSAVPDAARIEAALDEYRRIAGHTP